MSKADYFRELAYRLRGLPEKERQNIISVYEELFQKAVENGKREEDVAESLGYPRVPNWDSLKETPPQDAYAASEPPYTRQAPPVPPAPPATDPNQRFYAQPPYPNPYPYPTKPESGIKSIIISIGLGFFNLIFVLGPFCSIVGALISLLLSGGVLLIAPVAAVVGSIWMSPGSEDLKLITFAMLACFGLGILLTAFSVWAIKLFFKLTWKYVQLNVKLIKGV